MVPGACAGCATPWPAPLCADCALLFGVPVEVRPGPPPVFALGRYAGPLRSAVLAYKERGHRELAEEFGAAVAGGLTLLGDRIPRSGGWWLVPAPSRAAQARRRGGDHVRRLADVAARELAAAGRAAAVAPALRLSFGVRDSVGLDAAARAANLAGRVRVRRSGSPPPGTGVVLVDDVLTTGATVDECVRALGRAGLPTLAVLVLTTVPTNLSATGSTTFAATATATAPAAAPDHRERVDGAARQDCCRRPPPSTFDGYQASRIREEGSGP